MDILYFFGETPPPDLVTLAFCAGLRLKHFSPAKREDTWAFDFYGVAAVPHVRLVTSLFGASGHDIVLPELRDRLGVLELPLEVGGC